MRAALRRLKRDSDSGRSVSVTAVSGFRTAVTSASLEESVPKARQRHHWPWITAGLLGLVLIGGAILMVTDHQPPSITDLKQQQLTANSSENAVSSGAISPDGKYLVYADLKAIHLKLLETGETQTVPQPETLRGIRVDWFFGSWFPGSGRYLANASLPGEGLSAWTFSVMGGTPHKLRDNSRAWSVSPDGSTVALTANPGKLSARYSTSWYGGFGHREIWLMGPAGEQVRKLCESDENSAFWRVQWSPDGRRVAYLRFRDAPEKLEVSIESRDLKGGPPTTILSGKGIEDFRWLPDGRMIYSLDEPDPDAWMCNFWEARVGTRGEVRGKPWRLTNWAGSCESGMSVTADSTRLAFRKSSRQSSVYVGDLEANGTKMTTPRRLMLTESWDYPSAWTADSKAVLFFSDRKGHGSIFRQSLEEDTAQSIETGPEEGIIPRLSPDGVWILYLVYPKGGGSSAPARLMRVPVTGGPPQLVLTAAIVDTQRCARSPATLCAIAERTPDRKQLVFTAFDPEKGRGSQLLRLDTDRKADFSWDLSPDGTRIALRNRLEAQRIHILSLNGQPPLEINLKDWNMGDYGLDWAADGEGLFVSSSVPGGVALRHVDLKGNAQVLWEQQGGVATWGVPSADGHRLAMPGNTQNSNIWMIQNF